MAARESAWPRGLPWRWVGTLSEWCSAGCDSLLQGYDCRVSRNIREPSYRLQMLSLEIDYASSNTRGFSVKSAHCTTQSGKGQQLVQDGDWLHDFRIVRQRADLLPGSLRCAGSLKLAMKVRIGGNHRTPVRNTFVAKQLQTASHHQSCSASTRATASRAAASACSPSETSAVLGAALPPPPLAHGSSSDFQYSNVHRRLRNDSTTG